MALAGWRQKKKKPVNVIIIIREGGNCNLMSSRFVTECDKTVYGYASNKPLQLRGKCNLTVQVPQTRKILNVEFYVTRDKAALLGVIHLNCWGRAKSWCAYK